MKCKPNYRPSLMVYDEHYEECWNLIGVFRREFPIVCNQVSGKDKKYWVSYEECFYTIQGIVPKDLL